jgi:hypothetical protein
VLLDSVSTSSSGRIRVPSITAIYTRGRGPRPRPRLIRVQCRPRRHVTIAIGMFRRCFLSGLRGATSQKHHTYFRPRQVEIPPEDGEQATKGLDRWDCGVVEREHGWRSRFCQLETPSSPLRPSPRCDRGHTQEGRAAAFGRHGEDLHLAREDVQW